MNRLERLKKSLSSVHHSFTYYDRGESIHSLLRINLPGIVTHTEGIYVNGRQIKFDFSPISPVKIEYFEKKEPDFDVEISANHIIYQDQFILIIYKPKGLSTLPTRERKTINLKHKVESLLGYPVHLPSRLDTSTEGLVVLSKNEESHNALQSLFVERRITKKYLFETASKIPWSEKSVLLPIVKDLTHPILRTVSSLGTKPARTDFTKLEIGDRHFVLARPLTGRTHQIRVHAMASGIPIIGDNFYEGKFCNDGLRLISYSVSFAHPITNEKLTIFAPRNFWPAWAIPPLELLEGEG